MHLTPALRNRAPDVLILNPRNDILKGILFSAFVSHAELFVADEPEVERCAMEDQKGEYNGYFVHVLLFKLFCLDII